LVIEISLNKNVHMAQVCQLTTLKASFIVLQS